MNGLPKARETGNPTGEMKRPANQATRIGDPMKRLTEALALAISLLALSCAPANAQTPVPGATPGSFSVDRMGEANYRIPIRVPPGIAGMEPQLALLYNSSAPNDRLGVGWSLAGLSEIARCARTVAQDGVRAGVDYSMNDRYCMGGERLVAVPDSVTGVTGAYGADKTEYRTEIESFSKVISYGVAGNGPQYFKVWRKDGRILEYGNTADSRILADGKSTARVWALNRELDRYGNYMDFSYVTDNWELFANAPDQISYNLSSVRYGGNLNKSGSRISSVDFWYEERPDVERSYEGGSLRSSKARLFWIFPDPDANVDGDDSLYELSYEKSPTTGRSRLIGVAEYGVGDLGYKMEPTTFKYPTAGGSSTTAVAAFEIQSGALSAPKADGYYFGDFDGDGYMDILRAGSSPNDTNATTGSGNVLYYGKKTGAGFELGVAVLTGYYLNLNSMGNTYIGDFNGDGKADILVGSAVTSGPNYLWYGKRHRGQYPTGDKHFSSSPVTVLPGVLLKTTSGTTRNYTYIGDFNGDGRADVLLADADTQKNHIWYGAETGFVDGGVVLKGERLRAVDRSVLTYIGDFNGDGMADILRGNETAANNKIWYGTATGFTSASAVLTTAALTSADGKYATYIGDFNGDGKADVLRTHTEVFTRNQLWYGTGAGFAYHGSVISDRALRSTDGARRSYIADFNGDGKTDLLLGAEAPTYANTIYYGAGAGFSAVASLFSGKALQNSTSTTVTTALNLNGDRSADLFIIDNSGGNTWGVGYPYLTRSSIEASIDVLESITDGLGATVSITTAPYTKYMADVVRTDGPSLYPYVDVLLPMPVVESTTIKGGATSLTTNYSYIGLRSHYQGRGLLGFGWLQKVSDDGVTVTTEYLYEWPYTGMQKEQSHGGSTFSRSTSVEVMCLDPADATLPLPVPKASCAGGARAFPYVSKTTERGEDRGSETFKLPTIYTTISNYDLYGNVGKVSITAENPLNNEAHGEAKNYVYYPADKANWIIGKVKTISELKIIPSDSYSY